MKNKENWNKCALCGNPVHPYQESSAEPLANGIACVNCAYSRVYPTRMNNGVPSKLRCERNPRTGKWETTYEKEDKKKE